MLFGLPERFALESDIYSVSSNNLLGHLCLWADNKRIGSYEQNVVLQTPFLFIKDFLDFDGVRYHVSLDAKSDVEILNIVHSSLYSDSEGANHESPHDPYGRYSKLYRKLEICPRLSPSFDGDQAILLEAKKQAQFVWKAYQDTNIYKISLDLGEVQYVLSLFVSWLSAELQNRKMQSATD